MTWTPTVITRFEHCLGTSMWTSRVVTDAGPAFLKALGNKQGPHALACEFVGTSLARWLGLKTLEFAIIQLNSQHIEIPYPDGSFATSGSAFITREVNAHPWGGSAQELHELANPDDITKLTVFDTWTLNSDRYRPTGSDRKPNLDNVLIHVDTKSSPPRKNLLAMDHSLCFSPIGQITHRAADIDNVKNERVYGMFPEFVPFITEDSISRCAAQLSNLDRSYVEEIVGRIPSDWDVDRNSRTALANLICQRGDFLATNAETIFRRVCWPGQLFQT